jgi:hypothetical protein
MSLTANFELTPRNSYFHNAYSEQARLYIFGPVFYPRYYAGYRTCFDQQHDNDETYFYDATAADPGTDYTNYLDRLRVPHIILYYNLSTFGDNKELALVFGFHAVNQSRILVYSNAEQLDDILLEPGDNQFLMEVESVDSLSLYFIHARKAGSNYGGSWFFKGISGYVV